MINGVTYTSSQTVVDTLVGASSNGCDSIATTNLTINNATTSTHNLIGCGNTSINGNIYTSSQVITDTLTGVLGCDSIVTTNLTINNEVTSTQSLSTCSNAVINGKTYTSSQTVIDTLIGASISGCDSIVTTNLTVNSGINAISLINGFIYYQENPVTGGVVKLIRKEGDTPQSMFDVDSAIVANDGSFEFEKVPQGNYLLKVKVDEVLYPNSAATYYDSTNYWQKASELVIDCFDSITGLEFNIINFPTTTGTASINGTIVRDGGNPSPSLMLLSGDDDEVNGIDISLEKVPEGIIVAGTTTDVNGDFTFNNIEAGNYRLIVDVVGFSMDTNSILSVGDSDFTLDMALCVDDNEAVISSCQALSTASMRSSKRNTIKVFPNPATQNITVEIDNFDKLSEITLKVVNSLSTEVYNETIHSATQSINVSSWSAGVYFLHVINGQHTVDVRKIVVNK